MLLRLVVVACCLQLATAQLTVLVKDFKNKEFYVLSATAIDSDTVSVTCPTCPNSAAIAATAGTPLALTKVAESTYTFTLAALDPVGDVGQQLDVVASGGATGNVVYYGIVRDINVGVKSGLTMSGAWQHPYTSTEWKKPEKRYIASIRTHLTGTALSAVTINYKSVNDATYNQYAKFGDQAVDAVNGGTLISFANQQPRKISIHYGATGVSGIQIFTSSSATAGTTYGLPGTVVTTIVEPARNLEGFVARWTSASTWFLLPVQYALYAPVTISYNVISGTYFEVNYKVVNHLDSLVTYWTERVRGDSTDIQRSQWYTFTTTFGIQLFTNGISTSNNNYYSLDVLTRPQGKNKNFNYGRAITELYSTVNYTTATELTTGSTAIFDSYAVNNDITTVTTAQKQKFPDTAPDSNQVLWPKSINFVAGTALKIVDANDNEYIWGADNTVTFAETAVDIDVGHRIVDFEVYPSADNSSFDAIWFRLSSDADETGHLLPAAFDANGRSSISLYPTDCPNCQLSTFRTINGAVNFKLIEARWRFVPPPYLVSLDSVVDKASALDVQWWQQDSFDYIQAHYQVASQGGDIYVETKCRTDDETPGGFVSCRLPHLSAETFYNVKLRGEKTTPNVSFAELTGFGNEVSELTTNGVTVDCDNGAMDVTVQFEAVPQSASLSQLLGDPLCVDGATGCEATGTAFDTRDIQDQRSDRNYFQYTPDYIEFSGYPSGITLVQQAVGGPFVGIRIRYAFLTLPIVLVPLGTEVDTLTFDDIADDRVTYVNLVGRTIWKVGVGFSGDNINRIQFYFKDDEGNEDGDSGCLGNPGTDTTGQCSVEDSYQNYLISSFSGIYVDNGAGTGNRITKLQAFFSLQVTPTLLMANRDPVNCALTKNTDVNNVENSYWWGNVTLDSALACGTTQSVVHQPNNLIQDRRFLVVYTQLLTRLEDDVNAGDIIKEGQAAISRAIFFQITPKCSYKADSELLIQFETLQEADVYIAGYSSLRFELLMYSDMNYQNAYSDMPVTVIVGGNIYYGVSLISEQNGLSILARDCWVSTSNSPTAVHNGNTVFRYELESDTCGEEDTWERVEPVRNNKFDPMMFQSFYMVNAPQAEIFIHCRIYACNAEETSGICTPDDTCGTARRRRRDLEELSEQGLVKREIVTSRTRIFLQNDKFVGLESSAMTMNVLASMFLFIVMTVFVAGLVIVRRKIKNSRAMAEKLVA